MKEIDLKEASTATVTYQAKETGSKIKEFLHQIKMEKLHQLHETGPRNEIIEQEQGQQELPNETDDSHALFSMSDDDYSIIDSNKDMFQSLDNELINSVLQDLDEEEEDYPPNEINETSELFQ